MSLIDAECRKAINAATQELRIKYDFSGETESDTNDLYTAIETIIANHIIPIVKGSRTITASPKSISKGKPKVEKKSSRANHYAFFHSCCSAKGAGHVYTLAEYNFKYQPEPSTLKKGRDIYDNLHKPENKDQLDRFKAFNSKGDIRKVVEFVESEIKDIGQMTRTAVIWNQFMSTDDHNKLKVWYAEATKDGNEVPEQAVKKLSVSPPIIKIAAKMRKPTFAGEAKSLIPDAESESVSVSVLQTNESPPLSTNNESDNDVYDALTENEADQDQDQEQEQEQEQEQAQAPVVAPPVIQNITVPQPQRLKVTSKFTK